MADGPLVEGYLTITPGGSDAPTLGQGGSSTAQNYFAQKAKQDAASGGPAPAAANPAPPIGLRASHKGKVVSVAYDWKFVGARGQNPTPFNTHAFTDDKPEHYSPNVRYEGDNAMRFNSDVTTTYGGQPGTGRGVKSDTYMDKTFPMTHSTSVRVNGSWAMRKDDLFYHNADSPENWNTIAKAQHPGPEDPKPAPPKTSWWGRQFNRAVGVVGVAGSVVEGVGGAALFAAGTGADATGVGAVGGIPAQVAGVAVMGSSADQGWANLKQVWYGEPQDTYLQKGVTAAAGYFGASPENAQTAGTIAGLGQAVASPGGAVGKVGKVAEGAEELGALGRTETEAQKLERLAADRTAKAKAAGDKLAETDVLNVNKNGVRISKTYRRPGFRKTARRKAFDEAKKEDGKVYDPKTGKEIQDGDKWDMGHDPGYEFWKQQESAQARGLTRDQFLEEYNQTDHITPELPSSNQGHSQELPGNIYYGP